MFVFNHYLYIIGNKQAGLKILADMKNLTAIIIKKSANPLAWSNAFVGKTLFATKKEKYYSVDVDDNHDVMLGTIDPCFVSGFVLFQDARFPGEKEEAKNIVNPAIQRMRDQGLCR